MRLNKLLEACMREVVIRSWWVYLFMLACFGVFEVVTTKQEAVLGGLQERLIQQERALAFEQERQADLTLQLNSQNDPAFVELTLMRCLGVIPEGQTKVYFYERKKP